MFRKRAMILFGLIVLAIFSLMFVPVKALTVLNGDQLIYAFNLKNNVFSVQWEHSVEKEAWIEYFTIQDNVLYLKSTKFKTFGAGVPSESEHPAVLKDGWVHMDVDRKIGRELVVRPSLMNDYTLQLESESYELNPNDEAYQIMVKETPLRHILLTHIKRMVR